MLVPLRRRNGHYIGINPTTLRRRVYTILDTLKASLIAGGVRRTFSVQGQGQRPPRALVSSLSLSLSLGIFVSLPALRTAPHRVMYILGTGRNTKPRALNIEELWKALTKYNQIPTETGNSTMWLMVIV